jgi:hypothetical protein
MNSNLQQLLRALDQVTAGMTPEQLLWRRQEGKWCTAEVLEHLSLTYSGTAGLMRKVLKADHPMATPRSFRHRIIAFAVVGMGYFPEGRKSPSMVLPSGAVAPEIVLSDMRKHLLAMDEGLHGCEERFGARVKIGDHPVLGALTAAQWSKFHLVHGLHHVKQIKRLRELQGIGVER